MVIRGSYCICIKVEIDSEIRVGSLGLIDFPSGLYIYVGSALNSLIPRLQRHIITSRGVGRVTHWHVDYLLREPGVGIEAIYVNDCAIRMECEIASQVAEKGEIIPKFGCSDCNCESHLFRVKSFEVIEGNKLKKIDLTTLASSPSPRLSGSRVQHL